MTDRPEVRAATQAQINAANPEGSWLASANAGSGKTKVLVDRVTRLLLGGTPPDKILCLTYTKAAANEMKERLFNMLGEWCVMDETKLSEAINKLFDSEKPRDPEFIRNARRLFAKALETPEGLKIQTIHAFCERVLGRFPVEANIQPGFEPLDEPQSQALRLQVEHDIFREAHAFPESVLGNAVSTLASERADQTIQSLMKWIVGHAQDIKSWQAMGLGPLREYLGLGNDTCVRNIKTRAWQSTDKKKLELAGRAMLESSANDRKYGQKILAALEEDCSVKAFDQYASGLMTKNSLRVAPVTKNGPEVARAFWGIKDAISDESIRVLEIMQQVGRAKTFNLTQALFHISGPYVELYEAEKKRQRVLDFNDQINLVRNLLTHSEYAAWVLYKLDYGVHHILVDEAQDTAPSQWSIIDAIRDGFDVKDPDEIFQEVKTFFAVGDEKQSIYSFQGARPEEFMARIRDAKFNDAQSVRMEMSFRSAPQILRMVDAVFKDAGGQKNMFDAAILDTMDEAVQHFAFRQDDGLVELWPLSPKPEVETDQEAWNTEPIDALGQSSSREQLAEAIAAQINDWLDKGEPIYDREHKKTRPMRADDILILVQKRSDFFDGVIRHLKQKNIPVAGADRLVISEALIVQDLLALTRFVLLPADDLSLSEVLKGPIFDFNDDELFELCSQRGEQTVWSRLQQSSSRKAQQTKKRLQLILGYARQFAPYEFYSRVLDMIDDDGNSLLKRIYGRLSMEAQDALEAFLNKALLHQRHEAPSLQHFLHMMMSDEQDIKREMDIADGQVRVMTVHGSKGLEAPVVILPDTTQTPRGRNSEQMLPTDYGLVYLPKKDEVPDELMSVWKLTEAQREQEYMRLLYVAMTRAESRLVVCGYSVRQDGGREKGCWYDVISKAISFVETSSQDHKWGEIIRYGRDARKYERPSQDAETNIEVVPNWALHTISAEPVGKYRLTPSDLLAGADYGEPPVRSPLSQSSDRFRRGNLTHKLLEILPDILEGHRRQAAKAFLKQHKDLSEHLIESIEKEVFQILENPEYAVFFGPGSMAEVNLAGQGENLPEEFLLNAQIDRLAVTDKGVYIVDYKSNRPPPDKLDDVPEIYWGQMAAYREMIRLTHLGQNIICALLWTDGPELMILPDDRLDLALTKIKALPT